MSNTEDLKNHWTHKSIGRIRWVNVISVKCLCEEKDCWYVFYEICIVHYISQMDVSI